MTLPNSRQSAAGQTLLPGHQPKTNASAGAYRSLLENFQSLSLADLGQAALQDRRETKFIFHRDHVSSILPEMVGDYQVLEIQGSRICDYRTVYYDTSERLFFQQHMRGAGTRWKIRQRTYLDSNLSFLEVKIKDNQKQTRKKRLQLGNASDWDVLAVNNLMRSLIPISPGKLNPVLEVRYSRSTLVKKDLSERITLDQSLAFSDGKSFHELPGLVIAEVKQAARSSRSPFFQLLKLNNILPTRFSKYCVGTILTRPEIKHNRYKPVFRKVPKIITGGEYEWIN